MNIQIEILFPPNFVIILKHNIHTERKVKTMNNEEMWLLNLTILKLINKSNRN